MEKKRFILIQIGGIVITPETTVEIYPGEASEKSEVEKFPKPKTCPHGLIRIGIPITKKLAKLAQ